MKYAIYDMYSRPMSFSFLVFCIVAKSRCEAMGEECRIIFKKGFREPNKSPYSIEEKKFRIIHMLYPICALMGLDYSTYISSDIKESCIFPEEGCGLETILRQAKETPMFWPQPSERAIDIVQKEFPEKPVVITLRETNTTDRNSNVEEWIKFAGYVYNTNKVVFVRDTDKWNDDLVYKDSLDMNLEPCRTFPLASIDLDIRLALYKHARINFSVGGGSTNFLRFSTDIPYRTFKYMRTKFSKSKGKFIKEKDFNRLEAQAETKEKPTVVVTQEQLRGLILKFQAGGPQKVKLPNTSGGFSVINLGDPTHKDYISAASLGSLTAEGFPPGSQFPWHTENQKIIWEEDDFENLKREYDKWLTQQLEP